MRIAARSALSMEDARIVTILMDPYLYGAYDVEFRGKKFKSYVPGK